MSTSHEDPDDDQLGRACDQVYSILNNFQRAEIVVARAVLKIDKTYARHVQNKKRGESIKSKKNQISHQPRFDPRQIFELLVMSELEKEEKRQEVPDHELTHIDWIKRLCKHLIKFSLTHTSYHAAVAVGRILCAYTAREIRRVYQIVAFERALKRGDPECCRARNSLRRSVARRFGIPEEDLFKETDMLTSSDLRVPLTAQSLERFAPSSSGTPEGHPWKAGRHPLLQYVRKKLHRDSVIEVDRMSLFFQITKKFNPLAMAADLKPFEESVKDLKNWWPLSPGAGTSATGNGNQGGNGNEGGQYDLQEIRDYVARERKRRGRVAPGSLTIRVDGIDCATISGSEQECKATFETDATMVDVVGQGDDGDVVMATYILTYDQPKTEAWTIDLPRSQKLLCTFEYDPDDRVRAKFTVTNSDQLDSAALPNHEYSANKMTNALSPAWLKARIILNFAGMALIAMAIVWATFLLHTDNQQRMNDQRAAYELNPEKLHTFLRDIGSGQPGLQSNAIAMYRAMSPGFAASVTPTVASVDKVSAFDRSLEISTDRSLDPQTRSLAERSRWQIMSHFQITEPSYNGNVNERQAIRGTTPFPGMRYYIIVTTPLGQDFVSSEARVSGDTWEGVATFGSAGAGAGGKFYVRVIATKASLSEGPYHRPADAISSDSIPVIRQP